MRIPSNSTFTKELSKRFNIIFNKDMPLCELTTIKEKRNGHEQSKKNVPNARAIRQEYSKKESIARTVAKSGTKNKEVGLAVTSS